MGMRGKELFCTEGVKLRQPGWPTQPLQRLSAKIFKTKQLCVSNTESCSSPEPGQDHSCLRFDGQCNCSKPYYLPEQLLKGHQDTFNERLNSSIHTILIITAFLSSDFEMQSSVLRRGIEASGSCLGPLQPGVEDLVVSSVSLGISWPIIIW